MYNFEITLPEKVSTNKVYSGINWRKRKEIADLFHQEVLYAIKKNKVKKAKNLPVILTFVFYFKARLLDVSNCSFMAKMIEDGLVQGGVLEDDNYKNVCQITMLVEKSKRKYDYCLIEIN